MCVKKTFLIVQHRPLGHYRASAAHTSRKALLHQLCMFAEHPGMNSEIIHTLLTLFDQCIAIDFPRESAHVSVHLLKSLIDRHGAYGHRAVAYNPFASLMNIVARREIHQSVAPPIAAPDGFGHLLFDARRQGGISDIGVELYAEGRTNHHRFSLRVVDIGSDDGASCRYLIAHEFRSDVRFNATLLIVEILAYRHILHLRSDYTLSGIMHLSDAVSLLSPTRLVGHREADGVKFGIIPASAAVFTCDVGLHFGVITLFDPGLAVAWQPLVDIHRIVRIGVKAAGVVYCDILIRILHTFAIFDFNGRVLVDYSHSHLYREKLTLDIDFI